MYHARPLFIVTNTACINVRENSTPGRARLKHFTSAALPCNPRRYRYITDATCAATEFDLRKERVFVSLHPHFPLSTLTFVETVFLLLLGSSTFFPRFSPLPLHTICCRFHLLDLSCSSTCHSFNFDFSFAKRGNEAISRGRDPG